MVLLGLSFPRPCRPLAEIGVPLDADYSLRFQPTGDSRVAVIEVLDETGKLLKVLTNIMNKFDVQEFKGEPSLLEKIFFRNFEVSFFQQ